MADWRDGHDPKPPRKPAKPTPASPPAAPEKPTSDWRGRSTSRGQSAASMAAARERSWQGSESPPPKITGWRRRIFLIIAAIAVPILSILYIRHLFQERPRLPLLIAIPTEYKKAPELAENPYSTRAAELFAGTNQANILLVQDAAQTANDTPQDAMLDNLRQQDLWQKKYSDKGLKFRADRIMGGGPNRDIIAVYLSGFIVVRRNGENVSLDLVSVGDEPFNLSKRADNAVPLDKVLSRIVSGVSERSKVWITLDVRATPVVANLGDLECPLNVEVRDWYNALSTVDKNRTIVTLPGTDIQENWFAPELGSTVLGHFYRMSLAGAFDKKALVRENAVTLEKMRHELTARVDQWVRDNRFATQTPQWIPENIPNAASIEVVSINGPVQIPELQPHGDEASKRFDAVQRYWNTLDGFNRPYRWSPMAYAEAESLLIRMQDLLEGGVSTATWNSFDDQLRSSLARLQESVVRPPRVSLIEHRSADQYVSNANPLASRSAAEFELWRAVPPWQSSTDSSTATAASSSNANSVSPAPAANNRPRSPSVEFEKLTRDERCHFIVDFLSRQARIDDDAVWQATFHRAALQRLLEIAGPINADQTEWLEIHFLKLMLQEIDWINDDSVSDSNLLRLRSEACAKLWRGFESIQRLSTDPDHELSWWLRDELADIESAWLQQFDMLSANQIGRARDGLETVSRRMEEVVRKAEILRSAMLYRDQAAWVTPHLLNWLVRKYQFIEETGPIVDRLKQLGDMVTSSQSLNQMLRPTINDSNQLTISEVQFSNLQSMTDRLRILVEEQLKLFRDDIELLKLQPSTNPQSIRNYRLAVRTPLLDERTRQEFSKYLSNHYTREVRDAGYDESTSEHKDTKISEHSAKEGVQHFLDNVRKTESYTTTYEYLARGDLRLQMFPELISRAPSNQGGLGNILKELVDRSYEVRVMASAFGSHGTLRQLYGDLSAEWPWSAPQQLSMLHHAHHHQVQIERLAMAGWGDGNLDRVLSPQQLYFHRLASSYSVSGQISRLAPSSSIDERFLQRAGLILSNAARRVLALKMNFLNGTDSIRANSRAQVVQFAVPSDSWAALPSIYLDRQLRFPLEQKLNELRTVMIDLKSGKPSHEMQLDAASARDHDVILALRGNFRPQRLTITEAPSVQEVVVSFNRSEPELPTIKVSHVQKEATTILVLMDCSASMKQTTADPANPNGAVTVFQLAKSTTSNLLQAIQEIHQSQPIRVGLILFGLRPDKVPAMLASEPKSSNQTYYSPVEPAERGFTNELIRIIQDPEVRPSGCTPLYDALAQAYSQATTESTLIYVVSDGFNDTASTNYEGQRLGSKKVAALKVRNSALNIFQFSNSYYEVNNPEFRDEAQRSEAELRTLADNYLRSSSFDEIKQAIADALPRSEVAIYSGNREICRGRFGEKIEVPISKDDELPYRVKVQGTVGSKRNNQSKDQSVQLVGGEDLRLEFDEDSSRLRFVELKSEDQFFAKAPVPPKDTIIQDSNNLNLRFGALPRYNPIQSNGDDLSFQIGISHVNERNEFTPRPLFVLGRIGQVGAPSSTDFLIADFGFEINRHYPIFNLPKLPWSVASNGSTPQARLTLWLAFQDVNFKIPKVQVEDGASLKVPQAEYVTVRRNGQTITVEVPQAKSESDRLFVLCMQAERSVRRYSSQDLSETHTFTLFDSVTGPATIQLISVDHLQTAVNNRQLMEIPFRDVSLRKAK